jgi:RimJ/RimL family protein N-acetyltransferase
VVGRPADARAAAGRLLKDPAAPHHSQARGGTLQRGRQRRLRATDGGSSPGVELLCTGRLRLRAWTAEDADLARLADLYSREEVTRWLGGGPTIPPAELVERWALVHRIDPAHGCWAIDPLDGGPTAGTVLLKPLPNGVGEVEVGWHLHPDSWGHGYATEAARAVVDRAFDDGLLEVYAVVRPGNEPSLGVCRRLGMRPLGRTTRWYGRELEAFRLDAPDD